MCSFSRGLYLTPETPENSQSDSLRRLVDLIENCYRHVLALFISDPNWRETTGVFPGGDITHLPRGFLRRLILSPEEDLV
jgi:hypothetical protein